jgi:nitrogen regulatory protein P-II 1
MWSRFARVIRFFVSPNIQADVAFCAKNVQTSGIFARLKVRQNLCYAHKTRLVAPGDAQSGGCRGAGQRKGQRVKLIIAAIKPFKLEEVREALTTIGVRGMMVTEIKGFGAQSGHTEIYRGAEYAVNFVPKIKLEIVVGDDLADQVVATIAKAARTDKIGDGKIFVLDVAQAVRVRTGETNDDAL